MALNPVDEPLTLYCQPVEDILPQPEATLVTGITPQIALRKGLVEPDFIARVEAQMARPATCVAGYNSIRFDDEVTRYTLYRNFHDPYAREWRNGNSRWDIIDMVRLVYALKPETLNWPEREPGVPNFKLEALSQANDIEHQSAHDALSDVEATIALARLIKERQPALYDYCWQLRSKQFVLQNLHLGELRPLLHVSARYPAGQGCLAIVVPLARLQSNPNAIVVFDLQADPADLGRLDAESIRQRVFVAQKDLPEGELRLPLKLLHLNRSPVILPVTMLSEVRATALGIDRARAEAHWQALTPAQADAAKLEAVFKTEPAPREDAETALYDAFIPDEDRTLCEQIRGADAATLAAQTFPFRDARLKELFFHYRARFFPTALPEPELRIWREQVRERLMCDDPEDRSSLTGFFSAIDKLSMDETMDEHRRDLLAALRAWGEELQQKYSQA